MTNDDFSLDDFPPVPGRPTHPDMTLLAKCIITLDGEAMVSGITGESDNIVETTITNANVDPDSLSYMTGQRAQMMTSVLTDGKVAVLRESDIRNVLAAGWLEGFLLAARFYQEKGFVTQDAKA